MTALKGKALIIEQLKNTINLLPGDDVPEGTVTIQMSKTLLEAIVYELERE